MAAATDKLLVLGFDGADPDLLQRWIGEGRLPNIQRLINGGVFGRLKTVPNMLSSAAWTSFATGKNPGKHGIFGFTQRDFETYSYRFVNGSYRKAETFWERLCGPRTGCVVNVPMTYPARQINGCMIAGFDAPGTESRGFAYPENLVEELSAANGPYRVVRDLRTSLLRRDGDWARGADALIDYMEMRCRHIDYLMDKYDWQLFSVVFSETDYVQHLYWKFLDPSHPEYSDEDNRKYGGTILRIYQRMDDIVGRMVTRNPEAALIIVSDHGGAMYPRGDRLVPDWLSRLGLLTYEEASLRSPKKILGKALSRAAAAGYSLANRRLSTEMKFKLLRAVPALRDKVESARRLGGIDWSRTKAFSDGVQDEIWINLKGRDPLGIVDAGEYERLRDYICEELKGAVDASTGRPIVEKVFTREEAYKGDYVDYAPDISIVWKSEAVITGIKSPHAPQAEPVEWSWPYYIPTGGHGPEGIFIASGPGLARGVRLEDVSIVDVAPAVYYLFGSEIPEDVDGRVIKEMFDGEFFAANPPQMGESAGGPKTGKEELYSEEDSEVIEQRLRDLGYI